MFNFAIERDWLDVNPCHMIKRVVTEQARDRVLTEDEIRAVWSALDHEHPMMAALDSVAPADRAARRRTARRQVGGVRPGQRLVDDSWRRGARTGCRIACRCRRRRCEIVQELHDYRSECSAGRTASSVRPGCFRARWKTCPHVHHAQKAFERLVERESGVKFRGHDLRRTAASLMVGGGVPRLVVSKILNHVETGVTAVYDRHGYDAGEAGRARLLGQPTRTDRRDGTFSESVGICRALKPHGCSPLHPATPVSFETVR